MPSSSFKSRIQIYCTSHSVVVPPGFGRNSPSRYAIILNKDEGPRLVAKTWMNKQDLAYYIEHTLIPEKGEDFHQHIEILDFKNGTRLQYSGSGRFKDSGPLDQP
jgi:hypothetical protein